MSATSEIAIGATVVCADGELGKLTDVVVNPVRRRLTHIVVEERGVAGQSRMVPVELIVETTRDTVRLSCTRAEAARLPEFYATRYVPASSPEAEPTIQQWQTDMALGAEAYGPYGYSGYYTPYATWPGGDVPITEERVPPGEASFHRGTTVVTKDDVEVGTVEEFVIDPHDDAITHFVVRLGHLRMAREVALPVSTVASATPLSVTLKLSRAEIERLPAISVRRHYEWSSGSAGEVELVTLVFATPDGAKHALAGAKERVSAGQLPKMDAATLTKSARGKVSSHQEHDMSGGRGAVLGAIAGGAVSLLAGPIGPVAGAVAGGAVGGLAARAVDTGVPNRYVADLGRALQPGTSALVVLIQPSAADDLVRSLEPFGGTLLRQLLTDDMIHMLTAPPAELRRSGSS